MRCPPLPRRRRRAGAAALLLAVALLGAACADPVDEPGDAGGPSTTTAVTTDDAAPVEAPSDGAAPDCPAPEGPLGRFGRDAITVVGPDGGRVERCVLVADDGGLRSQGMMGVTDLDGFDGMVFAYAGTSSGGYWMRDTPMPLTIAWIGVDGRVVATADMEPCLDRGADCPSYEPGAEYRWAIEVPQGQLEAFGLGAGGRVDPASMPEGRS
ncbi:DUF192 domain-containing protein [Actinomarinicola tropica]|uniref:DUF192 domain-containing protein n=1 Tax=Actinomarinicola tropica TaxID=2789776 RepID=A0A5Q2RUI1_9ACTN|nr:DUF192 domain-containing protein [Actinomarinicola tropica]QGG96875.1 hypothetical protein GH723_18205 [Actinomarinicola tropica]